MADDRNAVPDHTAVRVALWRAIHLESDPPPHVFEDDVGLKLAAPDDAWRSRPDMHPQATSRFRASILARARFIEDLVAAKAKEGVTQYVILGAGLDTFVQRKPELASTLKVYEVDQPATQAWKRQRLTDLGYGIPDGLKLVSVNFEARGSWPEEAAKAGFEAKKPAVIVSTGVSMYLTHEANTAALRQVGSLAPGTTFAMTFMCPIALADPADRQARAWAEKGAAAAGTPFISFYTAEQIVALAHETGFSQAQHVSAADLNKRYFAGRTDGLRTANSEELLVATV